MSGEIWVQVQLAKLNKLHKKDKSEGMGKKKETLETMIRIKKLIFLRNVK